MHDLSLSIWPRAGGGAAAPAVSGDILAARVLSRAGMDGGILEMTLKGLATGGAYALDPLGTPRVTLAVQSAGFDDAGVPMTRPRTVVGTVALRKAYPDHLASDEATSGSDAVIRVALSDQVYAGDAVTLTALAGFYTGANARSTPLTVTNQSTATPPAVIANWATVQYQRAAADFPVELSVTHWHGQAGKMAAAVKFTATGQTSGAVHATTVASMTASNQPNRTGYTVPVYRGTIPLAGFTQGEVVIVDAEIFPFVGTKLQASVDGQAWPTPNLSTLRFVCDKNDTLKAYASVRTTGSLAATDTSGCSATDADNTANAALCYPNVDAAARALLTFMGRNEQAGGVIYLHGETHSGFGGNTWASQAAGNHWLTVTKAPSASKAATIFQTGTNKTAPGKLCLRNLTLAPTGTGTNHIVIDGADTTCAKHIWIDDVDYDGLSDSNPTIYRIGGIYLTNSLWKDTGASGLKAFSTQKMHHALVAGNILDNAGNHWPFTTLGNRFINGTLVVDPTTLAGITTPTQIVFVANQVFNLTATSVKFSAGPQAAYAVGIAVVQNVFENTSGSQIAVALSNDGDAVALGNAVFAYNTVAGDRVNFCYNDVNSTFTDKRAASRFNCLHEWNNKRDTFLSSPDAARVGCWLVSHHVGSMGDVLRKGDATGDTTPDATSWLGEYFPGETNAVGIDPTNPFKFTTDASAVSAGGSGAGQGNYLPSANTSQAKGRVPAGRQMLPFDILGTARVDYAGAFEGPA